jgi:cytochrome c-type biogenesis protein CcsB
LAGYLPQLAPDDVYPSRDQRAAEAHYYAQGKFVYGWLIYFFAFLFSVAAMSSRWKTPRVLAYILLIAGLILHAYGLGLRWYILGRIPVANMFEAVNAAAWMGIATVLVVELFIKSRVLLVAASSAGFLGLVTAGFLVPGAELSTIPGILDDIQLRLHTVLIIAAYALIFIAAVIGFVYLLGYYGLWLKRGFRSPEKPMGAAVQEDLVVSDQRPLLAGALPGDEGSSANLPGWLNNIDWSHLIVLNMVFILLFVGTILGAWWADYSWGRPWGWDPKEVFALVTWLVYAMLLHVRYVVRNRGLWTAWLSILGCAFMAFNWFFVNFYISSVHSYA